MRKSVKKILSLAVATTVLAVPVSSLAATVYVGEVGFDTNKVASDNSYKSAFNNFLIQNVGNGVKIDFNDDGKAVSTNDFANSGSTNIAQYDATNGTTVPANYKVWDGTGTPGNPVVSELKVESVSAINGSQVVVKFGAPVDGNTVFATFPTTDKKINATNIKFTEIGTAKVITDADATGELSADGKTFTITAKPSTSEVFEGRYDVVIDNVKTKDGEKIAKYEEMVTIAADKTAPTILGVEKSTATTVKVKFSEPMKTLGTVDFKLADGKVVTVTPELPAFAAGDKEVTYNIAGAQADGSNLVVGKEVTATFIGAQDQAGNLLTPNPAKVTFTKGEKDGVKPTVSAINQTEATKFTIRFSEPIVKPVPADIAVNGVATTGTTVKEIGTDSTTFEFTAASALDGVTTVATAASKKIVDLSGEENTFSNVVTFVKDAVAPKVVSTAVSKDATDGKEYLELTMDKDVVITGTPQVATATTNGSYVENGITSPIANSDLANAPITYKTPSNKKVIRVELDTLLNTAFDKKDAKYTLNLTLDDVKSTAGVAITTAKVTFTRGEDVAANNEVVTSFGATNTGNPDKVLVTFTFATGEKLDVATATTISNYSIAGATIESIDLAAASGTTQVATLNLVKNSNQFSGARNVTIKNVKIAGSTEVMKPQTNAISLDENVRPTITKAELTAGDVITLTFSEAIKATPNKDAFVVKAGTEEITLAGAGATIDGTDAMKINIKLGANLTVAELATKLTVEATKTTADFDVKDLKDNKLETFTPVTVIK